MNSQNFWTAFCAVLQFGLTKNHLKLFQEDQKILRFHTELYTRNIHHPNTSQIQHIFNKIAINKSLELPLSTFLSVYLQLRFWIAWACVTARKNARINLFISMVTWFSWYCFFRSSRYSWTCIKPKTNLLRR